MAEDEGDEILAGGVAGVGRAEGEREELVEELVGESRSALGARLVNVKWIGWKHPTWEPVEQISPIVMGAYDAGKPYGKSKYPSMLKDPTAVVLEHTDLEKEMFGQKGSCTTHKEEQKRLAELKKQIQEERQQQELRDLQRDFIVARPGTCLAVANPRRVH